MARFGDVRIAVSPLSRLSVPRHPARRPATRQRIDSQRVRDVARKSQRGWQRVVFRTPTRSPRCPRPPPPRHRPPPGRRAEVARRGALTARGGRGRLLGSSGAGRSGCGAQGGPRTSAGGLGQGEEPPVLLRSRRITTTRACTSRSRRPATSSATTATANTTARTSRAPASCPRADAAAGGEEGPRRRQRDPADDRAGHRGPERRSPTRRRRSRPSARSSAWRRTSGCACRRTGWRCRT